jgi:hypothetical protein
MTNANDLLMGGGVKSAKFDTLGTTVGGKVVRPIQARQQTDFDSGKPKFYENGDPMMQIVVHVQTNLRDASDPTDDGVRALYLRGQAMAAARDAVKAAGGKGIEVGGEVYQTWSGNEPNSRGRGQDKKVYTVRYVLPSGNDALMGTPPPAPAAVPAQQPVNLPPLPPAPAPAAVADPAPAGVDAAAWAALTPEQRAQYRALPPA